MELYAGEMNPLFFISTRNAQLFYCMLKEILHFFSFGAAAPI
jgi:hypothetical protein